MSIISKLRVSVESATGLKMHNYDNETINTILYENPLPCAFCALLRDTDILIDGNQNREQANIALFFVNKTEFDFDSEENEAIIEEMKKKANTWLRSLFSSSVLEVVGNVRTTRIYNEYDAILTGIGFNLTIAEKYGFNACKETEFVPTNIKKITGNGSYNISEYYWVEVDVPSIEIYEINDFLHIDGLNIDENDFINIEERE